MNKNQEPTDAEKFALRIRWLREALGLNQEQMAEKMGVHLQTISRYERGELRPSGKKLSVLAEKTNANLEWLLTGEGEILKERQNTKVQESIPTHSPEVQEIVEKLIFILEHGDQDSKTIVQGRIAEEYRRIKEAKAIERQAKASGEKKGG